MGRLKQVVGGHARLLATGSIVAPSRTGVFAVLMKDGDEK
jgi:hypothetical protein